MVNISKQIQYWQKGADDDIETAKILLKNGKLVHGLFFCHLSIEKIVKAIVVKATNEIPPKTHDIFILAKKAEIEIPEEKQLICQILMKYQLEGRYPAHFPVNPQPDLTRSYFYKTQKLLEWFKAKL